MGNATDGSGEGRSEFASARRATQGELEESLRLASASPVVQCLLSTASGLLAVLNSERQIVAINSAWLEATGARALDDVFGLRPGESIHCVHVDAAPSGCGTGVACRTCGAAIAILACQSNGKPCEKECVLAAKVGDSTIEFDMLARANPLHVGGTTFTLVFLQDETANQQRQFLERVFYHDLNNLMTGLLGTVALYGAESVDARPSVAAEVEALVRRLAREIAIQRTLASGGDQSYPVTWSTTSLRELTTNVVRTVANHPSAPNREIIVDARGLDGPFVSDTGLLERCLTNLVLNALEATPAGGQVRITGGHSKDGLVVSVTNSGEVPVDFRPRLFQRYFSTKQSGSGRGHGLYAVRLFCERYLGGRVSYETSPATGTTFTMRLPRRPIGWTKNDSDF